MATLQTSEQQSKSVVHVLPVGPQQPQGLTAFGRHSPAVPSALKHGAGLQVPAG